MSERAFSRVAECLRPLLPPHGRAALLGVGAELRQDDYAGMYLAGLLKPYGSGSLLVVEGSTAPESCTGPIRRFAPGAVIVFDAARMGKTPGDCALLRPEEITGATFATHMLPLPITLSYLEACCGCTTAYVGIEPASIAQGIGMDRRVRAGVEQLAAALIAVLEGRA